MSYTQQQVEQAQQWVADVYHCSEIWGQRMAYTDMRIELKESNMEKDPDDYCPPVSMYRICADYWNELCTRFPQ